MKHFILFCTIALVLFSCKKEITNLESNQSLLVKNIKEQLRDSVGQGDFSKLDFSKTVITNYPNKNYSILRVPFLNRRFEDEFVLLKIETDQSFSFGKIVQLNRTISPNKAADSMNFNGWIKMYSLDRKVESYSEIKKGFIEKIHAASSNPAAKANVVIVVIETLPEVILVSSVSSNGNWSTTSLYGLQSMLLGNNEIGGGGAGGAGGNYSYSNPFGVYNGYVPGSSGGSTNIGVGGGGTAAYTESTVHVDFEIGDLLPAIDLNTYLKCFDKIPDLGSTCTIRILTDLPVDNDPNKFFNFNSGSPGHTFLQIRKSNGTQMMQQNIGFYPVSGWKNALSTAPFDGKFVDNTGHEFNASLEMNLTPENFKSTLIYMQYLARFIKYDIDEYNCTDFSLDVFNYKRGGNRVEVPRYQIPGGSAPLGSATPQGLYKQIVTIKNLGGTESTKVSLPPVKGYIGSSNGPCN